MRITRDLLLKSARDAAAARLRADRRIVCIFLTGSLLQKDPLEFGAVDIDLVMVHEQQPPEPREVVGLNPDVSLDILHYSQTAFNQPRRLRSDPFLGPLLHNYPTLLHDIQHWFEFIQASASAQFNLPQYALERSRSLSAQARDGWNALYQAGSAGLTGLLLNYFAVLNQAGDAVGALTGLPLPERHFFTQLAARAAQLQRPELSSGLINLLMPVVPQESTWQTQWLPAWALAYRACGAQTLCPVQIHTARFNYYSKAMQILWEQHPPSALWLLLRTWGLAVHHLPEDNQHLPAWQAALEALELDPEHLEIRLEQLDQYLDLLEETQDAFAQQNGV